MRIFQIKAKISKLVRYYKIQKEQKYLNKYVSVHDTDLINKSAVSELLSARKIIANYVSPKAISVDIYSTQQKNAEKVPDPDLKEMINIQVTNLLTGHKKDRDISALTDKINVYKFIRTSIIDNTKDDLQYVHKTQNSYEDTFLRNVYRTVTDLSKKLEK